MCCTALAQAELRRYEDGRERQRKKKRRQRARLYAKGLTSERTPVRRLAGAIAMRGRYKLPEKGPPPQSAMLTEAEALAMCKIAARAGFLAGRNTASNEGPVVDRSVRAAVEARHGL